MLRHGVGALTVATSSVGGATHGGRASEPGEQVADPLRLPPRPKDHASSGVHVRSACGPPALVMTPNAWHEAWGKHAPLA